MKSRIRRYRGARSDVLFDAPRCIHARKCVHGLPEVFDIDRRPWILPDRAANAAQLSVVVLSCPTGALHLAPATGGEEASEATEPPKELPPELAETTPEANRLAPEPDGPLYVTGDVEVDETRDAANRGDEPLRDTRVALCRCGASENRPLCDGRHAEVGFRGTCDIGEHPAAKAERPETSEPGGIRFTPQPDGPLLFRGPLAIADRDGSEVHIAKGALCRCGSSGNMPFCDASHRAAGFTAP